MIPTFNAARFLGDALDSVLAQSLSPTRILVVDDASTDDTVMVAERYAQAGHPVRCIRLERNGGPGTARNVAMREAEEPLVAFLDADDVWRPDHLRVLVTLLDDFPDAVLAHGRVAPIEAGTETGRRSEDDETGSSPGRPYDPLEALLDHNPVPQSAAVARRHNILRAGGYTEGMRHAEDLDLWLRLSLEGPFVQADEVTCLRRRHDGQATRQTMRMFRGAWDARLRYRSVATAMGRAPEPARFSAICAAAYARDLDWAWQSRDRLLLRDVLDLEPIVPGGAAVASEWRRRDRLVWPVWRMAAWLWDMLPSMLRHNLRRLRTSAAVSP